MAMTPERLEELADAADPLQMWRMPAIGRLDMPADQLRQLDTGVALRRYASHVRRLLGLLGTGKSLLITPLSTNGVATKTVPIPESHQKLLTARELDRSRLPKSQPRLESS
jgi:hypothetical protein